MYRVSLTRAARYLFLIAFIIFQAHSALAQATADPNFLEFDPSPDHSTLAGGTPLINEYLLSVYVAGQGSALRTMSLGKPSPGSDGKIRMNVLSLVSSFTTPGVMYEA